MPFMSQCRKRSFLDHFYKFGMVALLQGLSLLVLLSYAVPAIGQSGSQPVTATASPDQGLFTPLDEATSALLLEQTRRQGGTQVVARERFVTVNFVQLEQEATGQKVILNLFADVQLIADLVTRQRNPSGSYTWIGHLQGIPLSQAIFVVRDQALYGSIQALGIGEFAITPLGNGQHLIQQASANTINLKDDEVRPPTPGNDAAVADMTNKAVQAGAANVASADNGALIDVLVVHSDDVAANDAQSYAELFTAYTNKAYQNSNVQQRIWLVGVQGFAYAETGNLDTDLRNITLNQTPNVAAARNAAHADLVVFLVSATSSSCGGLGWVQDNGPSLNFEAYGFATMNACSFGSGVFAHELGHNMGATHDWFVSGQSAANNSLLYYYAHGYVNLARRFRTIMSYNDRCSNAGFNCTGIPYFANPAIRYDGAPTGVAAGTSNTCTVGVTPSVECDADVRLTFNNTASNNASFRSSQLTWTGAVNNQWGNAANWTIDEGVPGTTTAVQRLPRAIDHILIPSGLSNYPVISGGSVHAREVVIAAGAALRMTDGTLTVGWRWEDAGGFTGTGGTVIFNGPVEIAITTAPASVFANVQIGDGVNSPPVTLNSALDINGDLLIKTGAQLKAGNNTIKLAGNWSDEGNGFERGTSTVVFDGANQTVDKVITTAIFTENFNSFTGCCSSALPTGWERSHSDGFGFATGNGEVLHFWNSTDAWLFTPGFPLKPGLTYQLSFRYLKGSNSTSRFDVAYGAAQTAGAMTTVIGALTNSTTAYQTANFTFTVPTAGVYYFGIHSLQTDGYNKLDDFVLQATQLPTFYNLQIRSPSNTTFNKTVTVVNNLHIDQGGVLQVAASGVTVNGTLTNNGAIRQRKTVNGGATTAFLRITNEAGAVDQYYGVEITPVANMGATTVTIQGNQGCTESNPAPTVQRCYTITPTTAQRAQIRFYYQSAEANSNNAPNVYHYTGSTWALENLVGRGGSGNGRWVMADGIDAYSPFVLSDTLPGGAAPSAPVVTIALNGSDVNLTWSDPAVNTGYEVHRSNIPAFTPDNTTRITTLGAAVAAYTDIGIAGNPNVAHFYLVHATVGSVGASSNVVGARAYALNNTGNRYSLIALPFAAPNLTNAAALANYIGAGQVSALLKWNPTAQSFRFFAPPNIGDNFALATGEALFVAIKNGGPSQVAFVGDVTARQHPLTPGGYNFLSLPLQRANLTTAADVAADIGGVQALLGWNAAGQSFRFFSPPAAGDNFAVTPGQPFIALVLANGPVLWPANAVLATQTGEAGRLRSAVDLALITPPVIDAEQGAAMRVRFYLPLIAVR